MTGTEMAALPAWLIVSRETLERLTQFCTLVRKWNPAINLVSKSDSAKLWERHLLDSAQLFSLVPLKAGRWADLGSGSGFPGIVVAILAAEQNPVLDVHLVEADLRKAIFLGQAIRHLGLKATVHRGRSEELDPLQADVVSARALAALPELCGLALRHLAPAGVALFPKGEGADAEVLACRGLWEMNVDKQTSRTRADGVILKISGLRHV